MEEAKRGEQRWEKGPNSGPNIPCSHLSPTAAAWQPQAGCGRGTRGGAPSENSFLRSPQNKQNKPNKTRGSDSLS